MRVLLTADPAIAVPPQHYGGIERIVDALARSLRARGHEVGLLAHGASAARVDRLFAWPAGEARGSIPGAQNAAALRRAVRSFRPDVVHSFSRLLYLLPLAGTDVPRVMSFQRRPTPRTVAWSRRIAGDRLVFTGCSAHLCRAGARGGGRWYAIPNFVELDRYEAALDVRRDAPLVFVGRIEALKGAHLAIAAARASGRRLLLAGTHSATPDDARYWHTEIAPQLAAGDVEYVGPVDDARKAELLRDALALLAPVQWDEPFGIVFAEALACGTPVISCPRGALPEIVRAGTDGFLVEGVPALSRAVDRVGSISRAACRARAESAFSAEVVVPQYEQLYRAIAGRRSDATGAPEGVCTS